MARQRLNTRDAADALGISVDAVRMRARRGTLEAEHANGRLYVWVDTDEASDEAQPEWGALTSEMRGRIEDLQRQLEAERRANEENRRIIVALTSRIPQIDPPPESPESPGPSGPAPTPTEAAGEPTEPSSRPWWRRMFGR